ncbi:class I SAM-dependent methyltransferase [Conexibacter sp. JD483]|uniref:class I SAM-dependent methyltransferase n=1 Tax=unclassified Conexibacter TaxID=2627773 RepID=UPI0027160A28|nr:MULTISPECIES: class I SAM-dependent methyltransferase [unclassified Conexibacter]MDO8184064.1 class I SAM-dependent methyltransferase [Conexibacter sp. CPCC 205706]MDO8197056.1 class I SAM-dependent methyltransferase [Conexibacter sp. CPCC 205762]MDR9367972.1 class I SAM-dependent methyltransferase [Conexibacter sp. JD483]
MTNEIACRFCGGPTVPAFDAVDRNHRLSDHAFPYVACTACGTVSLAEVPDDLGRYYPASYYGMPESPDAAVARDDNAAHRLELVRSLVPAGGSLLEIGPATGGFIELARRAGYDVSAIELDAACCAFISDVLGIPVTQSDDPAAALSGQHDAIVMWHVIEHLSNPAATIAAAAAALAPGGTLIVIAPNPRSLQLRVLGGRWAHVDPPRHLALIAPEAIVAEGARHGLQPVHQTTADEDARRSNNFGWAGSFASFSTNGPARKVAGLAGEAVRLAVAPIERRGGRGASYTLALRRPSSPS